MDKYVIEVTVNNIIEKMALDNKDIADWLNLFNELLNDDTDYDNVAMHGRMIICFDAQSDDLAEVMFEFFNDRLLKPIIEKYESLVVLYKVSDDKKLYICGNKD